ncbi:MAG: RNA-binding protein [Parcubacteria bacterium C7867-007]|nr:MAG: RNA-binding protein [Parcubacteria bacterium C7867-007]
MKSESRYWLVKSEPSSYSIDDLKVDKKTSWTGVRNYTARNFMRDAMKQGDPVLFYHSSCPVPGVYGIAKVVSKSYPDPTQFDPASPYYDPKATEEKPIWYLVDIGFVAKLKDPVTLDAMKKDKRLQNMTLLQRGNRLSVMEVRANEFVAIESS